MLVEPEVLSRSRPDATVAELRLRVARDLPWFVDHFPVHPMLPGVVQLGWAVRAAQREFDIDAPFRKVGPLKFQHPIAPGDELTLVLQRSAPLAVSFTYRNAQRVCSSGRLGFSDVRD